MSKIGKMMKGLGKKIGNQANKGFFVDVPQDKQNAVYQKLWGKKLNPMYGYGAVGVIGASAIGLKVGDSKNRHELGYMSAQDGPLSNMVGGATLSPLVQQLQAGEYDASNVDNSWNSRGADGDIVFALHNMR